MLALLIAAPALTAEDEIKRTSSGRPDLAGTYDAATLTPLQRPEEYGENLLLTREEAEKIAADAAKARAERHQVSDPDREAPPEGGDGSPGAAGNVGGYNSFWLDRGTEAFAVDGKFRTSIISWWEGDTLVIDSVHFRSDGFLRGATRDLHVTERLTLQPNGDILYHFTMDDPATWEAPWSGEYIWRNRPERVYEYACHEGNYAMGNTLRGARILEEDIRSGETTSTGTGSGD